MTGQVVGDVHRTPQMGAAARGARRVARSQWMQAVLEGAYGAGAIGLSWEEYQRQMRRAIVPSPIPTTPPKAPPKAIQAGWQGSFPVPPPKTPPLRPCPPEVAPPQHLMEAGPEVPWIVPPLLAASSKAAPAMSKRIPVKARPAAGIAAPVLAKAAVPVKAAPTPAKPVIDAETRKRKCTAYLMNRVTRTRVAGIAAESTAAASSSSQGEEVVEEFFTPGALLHLLKPVDSKATADEEDDSDDDWGKDWQSPSNIV